MIVSVGNVQNHKHLKQDGQGRSGCEFCKTVLWEFYSF